MSDDPMRILVVEPTKDPYVKEIDGSLASMQAIVGGFIQAVEPFEDPNVLLLCNEEAKLLGLPENRFLRNRNGIPYDIIHGTFFLAQGSGEEFCSLPTSRSRSIRPRKSTILPRRRKNSSMTIWSVGCA